MYLTNEIKLLPYHRDNAYKHGGIALRGSRRRNFDERQKMLISTPRLRASLLIEAYVRAYEQIWLPTGMIAVADGRRSITIAVSPRLQT